MSSRATSARVSSRPGRGGQLRDLAGAGREAGGGGRDEAAQPAGGRARVGGAGRLDGEQGVAVARGDEPVDLVPAERRDGADQPCEVAGRERPERELGVDRAACGERVLELVGGRARGGAAAGQDEQDGQAGDPPRDVRGELERGAVGEVDVVEQRDERPGGGGPGQHLGDPLEQARALEVGRAGGRAGGAAEPLRGDGREPRDVLRPDGAGRRALGRGEPAREVADELRPEAEGRRAAARARRTATVRAPRAAATASSSSANRVLPIPPSPVRTTAPPSPASARSRAAASRASSRSRPVKGGARRPRVARARSGRGRM